MNQNVVNLVAALRKAEKNEDVTTQRCARRALAAIKHVLSPADRAQYLGGVSADDAEKFEAANGGSRLKAVSHFDGSKLTLGTRRVK